jgi:hypothetical protein
MKESNSFSGILPSQTGHSYSPQGYNDTSFLKNRIHSLANLDVTQQPVQDDARSGVFSTSRSLTNIHNNPTPSPQPHYPPQPPTSPSSSPRISFNYIQPRPQVLPFTISPRNFQPQLQLHVPQRQSITVEPSNPPLQFRQQSATSLRPSTYNGFISEWRSGELRLGRR